jgi:hypothetical protein
MVLAIGRVKRQEGDIPRELIVKSFYTTEASSLPFVNCAMMQISSKICSAEEGYDDSRRPCDRDSLLQHPPSSRAVERAEQKERAVQDDV